MKKVLSSILVFFIIFNIIASSMQSTNMYNANVSKLMGATAVDEESSEEG